MSPAVLLNQRIDELAAHLDAVAEVAAADGRGRNLRLRAWELAHPTANPAAPPLLEWFITDELDRIVSLLRR